MMSSNIENSREISELAGYVRNTIYSKAKENRRTLEEKWERNINAYKRISDSVWKKGETKDWRSDTFVSLTKQKVLAGYSLVVDMLLQGGKIPFMLKPSPLQYENFEDLPEEVQGAVNESIDEMQDTIEQQLQDCNADRALTFCIMSGAIYGMAYAKKKIHEVVRKGYKQSGDDSIPDEHRRWGEYQESKEAPGVEYRSVWKIYWDMESDNIKESAWVIDRETLSAYQLRQKIGKPFFIGKAIEKAIKENKINSSSIADDDDRLPPGQRDIKNRKKTIEVLEFWGRVPRKYAEKFEEDMKGNSKGLSKADLEGHEDDGDEVEIMCWIAGDEVVRYTRTEPEDRPFYYIPWEILIDDVGAMGVADNVEASQKIYNGAIRALEDNKKLTSNVLLAIKARYLEKDLKELITGGTIPIAEECDDVRKAIQQLTFDDIGNSCIALIEFTEKHAEEESMIPKISSGLSTESPETAYEISQRQQQAGKYIAGVIRNYDEGFTEPVVDDFYKYNMDDPELEKGKGSYMVQALGFTSFQDRVVRVQKIMQFLQLAASYEQMAAHPKWREILEEIAKALDLDPDQVLKSQEDIAQEEEQAAAANQEAQAKEEQLLAMEMEEKKADIATKQAKAAKEQKETELKQAQFIANTEREQARQSLDEVATSAA